MLDIRYILLHTATTSAFTTTIIMRLPPLADQQKAAVLPNSAEVRKDLWTYYRILFRTWKNRELLPWHYSIGYLHIFWKIGKLGPVTKLSSKEMHLIDDIFLLY